MKINSKFATQYPLGILVVSLLSCMMFNLLNAQSIHVEKVFGPETDTGQYKHPSSFEYLDTQKRKDACIAPCLFPDRRPFQHELTGRSED